MERSTAMVFTRKISNMATKNIDQDFLEFVVSPLLVTQAT